MLGIGIDLPACIRGSRHVAEIYRKIREDFCGRFADSELSITGTRNLPEVRQDVSGIFMSVGGREGEEGGKEKGETTEGEDSDERINPNQAF